MSGTYRVLRILTQWVPPVGLQPRSHVEKRIPKVLFLRKVRGHNRPVLGCTHRESRRPAPFHDVLSNVDNIRLPAPVEVSPTNVTDRRCRTLFSFDAGQGRVSTYFLR
jgi:hypothetical protein